MSRDQEATREYNRRWRAANPEKCAAYTKKYRAKDPQKHISRRAAWVKKNRSHVNEFARAWRKKNQDKSNATSKRWRTKNPERQKLASENWVARNRKHINEYKRMRCATDPSYRLAKILRCRINGAIRTQSANKAARTVNLCGCTTTFLMGYLEALFVSGMTWSNYGTVWEIDHKIPCAAYDLTDESHQRSCFHYTNLQPLSVGDNRRKHAKLLPGLTLNLPIQCH